LHPVPLWSAAVWPDGLLSSTTRSPTQVCVMSTATVRVPALPGCVIGSRLVMPFGVLWVIFVFGDASARMRSAGSALPPTVNFMLSLGVLTPEISSPESEPSHRRLEGLVSALTAVP